MGNTYAAALETVKFYILNTHEFYSVIADNVKDARESRLGFANLIGCVMLTLTDYDGFRHLPEEFRDDDAIVLEAVTEIVEEWEL